MTKPTDSSSTSTTPASGPKPSASPRWRLIRRVLLIGACVVLLAVIYFSLQLSSIAQAEYLPDIATLVPNDVALSVEVRNLHAGKAAHDGGKLAEIVEFGDALVKQPTYRQALDGQMMKELLGVDARGQTRRVEDRLREFIKRVRETEVPIGDTLFGSLDPEEDFFSGDIVVAFRPFDGQQPKITPINEPIGDVPGLTRTTEKIEYPPLAWMSLVRVSGRMKIYASFEGWVPDYLPPHMTLEFKDGYRILTIKERGDEPQTQYFGLIGDVFALSNSEKMMQDVVALGRAHGRGGHSLMESPLYSQTLDMARKTAGDDAVKSATGRVFVDFTGLRQCMEIDTIFDMPDDMRHTQAGEVFVDVANDTVRTVVDMRAARAAMSLISVSAKMATGPAIVADTFVLYDPAKMNAKLADTLKRGGSESELLKFCGPQIFGFATINDDLVKLTEYLTTLHDVEDSLTVEMLDLLKQTGYLADEIGLLAAPQNMMNYRESDGTWPSVILAFKLTPEGQQFAATNPEELAEKALANLIPRRDRAEATGERMFPVEVFNDHKVVSIFIPRELPGGQTENQVPGLMRRFTGPDTDPAAVVVDGYFLVATSKRMLHECLTARDATHSRFGTAGDLGVVQGFLPLGGKAVLRAAFDSRSLVAWSFEDEQLDRQASERYHEKEPPPSVQATFLQQARAQSGTDPTRERLIYDRLVGDWMNRNVHSKKREYIRNNQAMREFYGLLHWFALQIESSDSLGHTCRIRFSTSLGGR